MSPGAVIREQFDQPPGAQILGHMEAPEARDAAPGQRHQPHGLARIAEERCFTGRCTIRRPIRNGQPSTERAEN